MNDSRACDNVPTVTVVIPCRNEARHIGDCLSSILSSGWDSSRLEVLVVDGLSDDGTQALVQQWADVHPCIRLVSNPARSIPAALNIGIREAQGEFVMRVDAHSALTPGYIASCVETVADGTAERVGGRVVTLPRKPHVRGRAIATALSSMFGIGPSRFRVRSSGLAEAPREVDTVPFWCCRRSLLRAVGLFDERLERSEDIEYSMRLRRAGVSTLLLPNAVAHYSARSSLLAFARHAFLNGRWAVLPYRYARAPVSWRHLAPLASILALGFLGVAALFFPAARVGLLVAVGTYGVSAALIAVATSFAIRDVAIAPLLPIVFAILHVSYGVGSVVGVAELVAAPHAFRPSRFTKDHMLVTFSGLDGAGKTTLIDTLENRLRSAGYKPHIRTMYDDIGIYASLRSLSRRSNQPSTADATRSPWHPLGNRLRRVALGIARAPRTKRIVFWLDLLWFRLYIGFVVGRRCDILVLDRYFYDSLVEAFSDIASSRTARLAARAIRRPDVALYIDVEPAEAFGRKLEYSIPELERRAERYRQIFLLRPEIDVVTNLDRCAAACAVWELVASRLSERRSRA